MPVKYEYDIQYVISVLVKLKNREHNWMEEIGLVTSTSDLLLGYGLQAINSIQC